MADEVTITGEALKSFDNGPVTRSFCGVCGSPIAYADGRIGDRIYFMLGAMDAPENYKPTLHAYVREQLALRAHAGRAAAPPQTSVPRPRRNTDMKLTLSWLKDHLDTDASLAEIVERLTSIGLEVESVDDKSGLKPFVIAKVLTAVQHPDADRLRVLTVDTGDGKPPVQVVCGAPNARAGLVGAFAAPGTYVPGIDVTLSVGKIRGVESHGMMCSERELELSDEHDGIIDLPDDAPVGTSFAAYAKLDDPVDRDRSDAEPAGCDQRLRHRARPRGVRSRQAEGRQGRAGCRQGRMHR